MQKQNLRKFRQTGKLRVHVQRNILTAYKQKTVNIKSEKLLFKQNKQTY